MKNPKSQMKNSVVKKDVNDIRKVTVDSDSVIVYLRDRTIKFDKNRDSWLYTVLMEQLQIMKEKKMITVVKHDNMLIYINNNFVDYTTDKENSSSRKEHLIDFTPNNRSRRDEKNHDSIEEIDICRERVEEIRKAAKKAVLITVVMMLLLLTSILYYLYSSMSDRIVINSIFDLKKETVIRKDMKKLDSRSSKEKNSDSSIEKNLDKTEDLIKMIERELQ